MDSLTKREGQVLQLVAQGLSNRETADRLFVSERTAITHVSNVVTKLKLASRTQAALWAVRQGLALREQTGILSTATAAWSANTPGDGR